jgi:hypothetical protein
VKQFGWPTRKLVGDDGATAAFSLLRNTSSPTMQAALLPVIIAATSEGEISLRDFAFYIDRLRLNAGLKQLFGTQATIRDGFSSCSPSRMKPWSMPGASSISFRPSLITSARWNRTTDCR